MDRPKAVNLLLQKHPELRAYVNHIEKENHVLNEHTKHIEQKMNELREELNQLKQRNKEIEEQLKEIKSYIWKPKNQTDKPKKLGPPKNHEPHNRPIPDKIHRKAKLKLNRCPDCNNTLSKPVRRRKRYVEDITQPEPFNTEYDIPHYYCRNCKKQVSPKPPDVIPKCRFGIRMMLFVTFLKYGIHIPFNKIATLLETSYGISASEGCLVNSITRFADYLGPEFNQIKKEIRKTAYTYKDTTSWRENGKYKVLWDFISEKYVLLLIRDTKAQGIVYQTLGRDYKGVSITDCAREYDYLGWRQQKCWVHFLRYTRKLESREGKYLHKRLKGVYHSAKSGKVPVRTLLKRVDGLCAISFNEKKCVNMTKRLQKNRDSLFTFVEVPGVSDNNNEAERGLRPSVVMRKISGGNRSPKGSRNHEVIMSVMGTWKKQGKEFMDYGYEYIQNHLP